MSLKLLTGFLKALNNICKLFIMGKADRRRQELVVTNVNDLWDIPNQKFTRTKMQTIKKV